VVTNADQQMRITTLIPQAPTYRVVDESAELYEDIYRLEVETEGSGQQYFLHGVQAMDVDGSAVVFDLQDDGTAFTVTASLDGVGCAEVVFQQGATATGGTFGFAADCDSVDAIGLTETVEDVDLGDDINALLEPPPASGRGDVVGQPDENPDTTNGDDSGDSSGCSCRIGSVGSRSGIAPLVVCAILALCSRRRRNGRYRLQSSS
jgi:hypothetical protein